MKNRNNAILWITLICVGLISLGLADDPPQIQPGNSSINAALGVMGTGAYVNDFTGQVAFPITLGSISGFGGIGYSVTLNYYSGGTKQQYLAPVKYSPTSWVGMGFNFQPPRIVSNTKGTVDIYDDTYYLYLDGQTPLELSLLDKGNLKFYSKLNPLLEISASLAGNSIGLWKVKFPNGNTFLFGDSNIVCGSNLADDYRSCEFASTSAIGYSGIKSEKVPDSWFIQSINDPLQKNAILFEYEKAKSDVAVYDSSTISVERAIYLKSVYSVNNSNPNDKISEIKFYRKDKDTTQYYDPTGSDIFARFEKQKLDSLDFFQNGQVVLSYKLSYYSANELILEGITVFDPNFHRPRHFAKFDYQNKAGSAGDPFSPDGRMKRYTDADGKTIEFSYQDVNPSNLTQEFLATQILGKLNKNDGYDSKMGKIVHIQKDEKGVGVVFEGVDSVRYSFIKPNGVKTFSSYINDISSINTMAICFNLTYVSSCPLNGTNALQRIIDTLNLKGTSLEGPILQLGEFSGENFSSVISTVFPLGNADRTVDNLRKVLFILDPFLSSIGNKRVSYYYTHFKKEVNYWKIDSVSTLESGTAFPSAEPQRSVFYSPNLDYFVLSGTGGAKIFMLEDGNVTSSSNIANSNTSNSVYAFGKWFAISDDQNKNVYLYLKNDTTGVWETNPILNTLSYSDGFTITRDRNNLFAVETAPEGALDPFSIGLFTKNFPYYQINYELLKIGMANRYDCLSIFNTCSDVATKRNYQIAAGEGFVSVLYMSDENGVDEYTFYDSLGTYVKGEGKISYAVDQNKSLRNYAAGDILLINNPTFYNNGSVLRYTVDVFKVNVNLKTKTRILHADYPDFPILVSPNLFYTVDASGVITHIYHRTRSAATDTFIDIAPVVLRSGAKYLEQSGSQIRQYSNPPDNAQSWVRVHEFLDSVDVNNPVLKLVGDLSPGTGSSPMNVSLFDLGGAVTSLDGQGNLASLKFKNILPETSPADSVVKKPYSVSQITITTQGNESKAANGSFKTIGFDYSTSLGSTTRPINVSLGSTIPNYAVTRKTGLDGKSLLEFNRDDLDSSLPDSSKQLHGTLKSQNFYPDTSQENLHVVGGTRLENSQNVDGTSVIQGMSTDVKVWFPRAIKSTSKKYFHNNYRKSESWSTDFDPENGLPRVSVTKSGDKFVVNLTIFEQQLVQNLPPSVPKTLVRQTATFQFASNPCVLQGDRCTNLNLGWFNDPTHLERKQAIVASSILEYDSQNRPIRTWVGKPGALGQSYPNLDGIPSGGQDWTWQLASEVTAFQSSFGMSTCQMDLPSEQRNVNSYSASFYSHTSCRLLGKAVNADFNVAAMLNGEEDIFSANCTVPNACLGADGRWEAGGGAIVEPGIRHTGDKSIKVTGLFGPTINMFLNRSPNFFSRKKGYFVSAWMYADSGASPDFQVEFRRNDNPAGAGIGDPMLKALDLIPDPTHFPIHRWVKVERLIPYSELISYGTFTQPGNNDYLRIWVGKSTSTGPSVFVDDVRVHPADAVMQTQNYDAMGRVTSKLDAQNEPSFLKYDAYGMPLAAQDGKGLTYTSQSRVSLGEKVPPPNPDEGDSIAGFPAIQFANLPTLKATSANSRLTPSGIMVADTITAKCFEPQMMVYPFSSPNRNYTLSISSVSPSIPGANVFVSGKNICYQGHHYPSTDVTVTATLPVSGSPGFISGTLHIVFRGFVKQKEIIFSTNTGPNITTITGRAASLNGYSAITEYPISFKAFTDQAATVDFQEYRVYPMISGISNSALVGNSWLGGNLNTPDNVSSYDPSQIYTDCLFHIRWFNYNYDYITDNSILTKPWLFARSNNFGTTTSLYGLKQRTSGSNKVFDWSPSDTSDFINHPPIILKPDSVAQGKYPNYQGGVPASGNQFLSANMLGFSLLGLSSGHFYSPSNIGSVTFRVEAYGFLK